VVDIDIEHQHDRWMLLPGERALVQNKIVANQLTFAVLLVFSVRRRRRTH
jgi:hypothetical protein